MRKFKITVNGNAYEVEVEELEVSAVAQSPRKAEPLPTPATNVPPAVNSKRETGGTTLTAPMPGTILDIKYQVGDTVSIGDVIIILEAMKMENDIASPVNGRIQSIQAQKESAVSAGDVLVVIEAL